MAIIQCRHFSGYKPCGLHPVCESSCPKLEVALPRILIVHLEAMGAVLRATSVLPALRRKFPRAHVTWVTQRPSQELLLHNPLIDRVLTTHPEDLLALQALEFDVAYCLDKSLKAGGVLRQTRIRQLYGFDIESRTGAVVPATPAAEELWQLGLSNHQKFFVNQKPETQLLIEALELGPYVRDEYTLNLSGQEVDLARERRKFWKRKKETLVGLNTGCSPTIPYKKWTVEFHREVIKALLKLRDVRVVLLGGPEDSTRNQQIAAGLSVVQSPTQLGLRDGLCSVAACDVVVSGDSLGMHMAIALGKWVVAWFGPTCAQEIELYGRGQKVLSRAPCGPCWKRSCDREPMCYDLVSLDDILAGVKQGIQWTTSSFKPPFLETSSLASL